MPLFNDMYFDQKWSLWDGWLASVFRGIRGYVVTATWRASNIITARNRRANTVTAQNRRNEIITSGG